MNIHLIVDAGLTPNCRSLRSKSQSEGVTFRGEPPSGVGCLQLDENRYPKLLKSCKPYGRFFVALQAQALPLIESGS